jgi:hypothetical protein
MAKRRVDSRTRKKKTAKRVAKKGPARSRRKRGARAAGTQPIWGLSKFALWSQRWGNPDDPNQTYPTIVLLRHPTVPFIGVGTIGNFEHDLQKAAHDYLVAANNNVLIDPPLELPLKWLDALDPDQAGGDPSFGWLPFESLAPGKALLSFVASRTDASGSPPDLMVILLASHPNGPGFGIRVVTHVRKKSPSQFEISISGMSASFPFSPYVPQIRPARRRVREVALTPESGLIEFLLAAQFRRFIASTLGLDRSSVAIQGIRLASAKEFPVRVELSVTGRAKKTDATAPVTVDLEPYYSFILATELTQSKDGHESSPLALVSKIALVADAAGPARIFPIDPASQKDATHLIHKRRPTRSEAVLDGYRRLYNVPDPLVDASGGQDDEVVVVCPGFVLEDFGQLPATKKSADLTGGPPVRSDDASAVEAYWNVKQFFDRLRAYGILPSDYFRIAPLPLEVHYRSGIGPGPGKDGQTVNARVRVKGFPDNFEGPVPAGAFIELHFALADLSTRARKPWDGKERSPARPLGIAADARWVWHEIGHVLLTTSVGELQFRFAHSPGDALAAIVSDPESELATDPNWRGSTFPWVFLPRRHDRCVLQGWSWSGGLHYGLSQVEDSAGPRRKGYWSEQILSSSLFRLYRSIGGDTTVVVRPPVPGVLPPPDLYARRSASHYCVYLIMRGIQILGTPLVVPTNEPDQFVSALIDADIHTATSTPSWHVVFPPVFPPPPPPPPASAVTFDRIGGCVHKVIRWAFEAQGLYRSFTNAPGYPPPVDVYIADLRPTSESTPGGVINYGPGSYNPVSLEWDPNQVQADPPPKWQADPAAITLSATGEISVVVGNRGNAPAQAVSVSVWWKSWPAGPAPQWDATWTQCAPIGPAIQNIPPNGQANFGPFAAVPLPAGTRYLLLAQATCLDDRANIDAGPPATNLPCSQKPTPLVDLVANDNNLGLRVLSR